MIPCSIMAVVDGGYLYWLAPLYKIKEIDSFMLSERTLAAAGSHSL